MKVIDLIAGLQSFKLQVAYYVLGYNTVTCAKCFGTFREILAGSLN